MPLLQSSVLSVSQEMTYGQHDEAEASSCPTAAADSLNGSSPTKRKVKEDGVETEPSKDERRERKRLKKLAKENATLALLDTAESNEKSETLEAQEAGAKAARKAGKASQKKLNHAPKENPDGTAAKETSDHVGETETVTVDLLIENTGGDKFTERAKIKAEKARLRAAKEAGKVKIVPIANGHIGDTHSNSKYQEDPALAALPQSEVDSFLTSSFITITDPTTSKALRPIISFSHLPPSALQKPSPFASFKNPTPIQSATWPFLLSGRDVIGVAETGSGKTLAFGVPCIRHIISIPRSSETSSVARAVIVSPTRELAVQIHEQIIKLAKPAGLKTVCVYGGVPKDAQRAALNKAHIIVATPGRLNDFINEGAADLSGVDYVVLDEADRMLDKGFEEEIRKIISATRSPSEGRRQTLMFTATWPPSVRELASTFMTSPVKIAIGDNPTGELRANNRIVQKVEVVDPRSKEMRLLQLIKKHQSGESRDDRILVFCLYKKEATRVEVFLRNKGLRVASIHGDLSQEKRTASLEAFKREGGTPLLVATDVAARGLDIPAVKVVINVTFPLTVEDYVHRIGRQVLTTVALVNMQQADPDDRTGRAGAEGLAITLFTEYDKAQSGALINVLKAAGQPVPEELLKFGTTVKKKSHESYGAFYKEVDNAKTATKIKFDD